ncbi:HNH endonuclease [Agrococcus jenensis]|uniref:Colicin-lik bacteriocin with DNase/tRNase domain n=1 Tax=Agrococcus jenensis TaxID=46353 RepID=A0A3N2ASE9_9MICO|nr:HNH endonuclease [Agrococcus jenensis]ROR65642.1 colicin-lik bacteriocin with DNase/tRNase domain [Agrococcus jenensis]
MSTIKIIVKEAIDTIEEMLPKVARGVAEKSGRLSSKTRQIKQQIEAKDRELAGSQRAPDRPRDHDAPDRVTPEADRLEGPRRPEQYEVYYEMTLDEVDWARSRSVHFNRANTALDEAMQTDADFEDWMESVSPGIADRVAQPGGRQNPSPADFIWHHAHPDTVLGRNGVMQLVPTPQHTPGSLWWGILHPGNRGGFAIWGKK